MGGATNVAGAGPYAIQYDGHVDEVGDIFAHRHARRLESDSVLLSYKQCTVNNIVTTAKAR